MAPYVPVVLVNVRNLQVLFGINKLIFFKGSPEGFNKMRSILLSASLSILVFLSSVQSTMAANIAIVDTGLNPNVLGGIIEPGGFDFYNNDADWSDDSSKQHGTATGHVAASSGFRVTLTPIKAFGSDSRTTNSSALDSAFNYIAGLEGVKVVSHSGASISNTPLPALQAAASAGKIIVFAAGNFAGASPSGDGAKVGELNGHGIVAGGLTPDGQGIQNFSNRAGFQQDWYILAHTNSLITSSNGTSMSAPRVAAAAATVLENHGFLAPDQVVQILLNTADDLGEAGVDPVYGHGALNLEAALSAAGAGEIPPSSGGGDDGGGSGAGAGIAALVLAGGLVYGLTHKNEDELQRTILVDAYGRAFTFDFANRISVRDSRPSIFSLMGNHEANFDLVPLSWTANSYTQALVSDYEIDPYSFTANDELLEKQIGFLHRSVGPESHYAMSLNTDLSMDFGALSLRQQDPEKIQPRFSYNDMFTTPILGYSSQGSAFMYGWDDSLLDHRFGLSVIDEQEENGLVSNSILYETRVKRDQFHIGMQLGALIENGSLLGGASDSALGVDQTNTYYLGFNGSYNLSNDLTLLGGYFQGSSSIDESDKSLLNNFSGIRTEGYALGVLVDNLFSPNGSFGFSYSSPLQTTDGSATMTLPVSQDMSTGAIGYESTNLSFHDADKEKILEAYYNYQLSPRSNVFTHLSYTQNPVSNLSSSQESTVFVGWKHRF
jgi:hypothetical protein